MKFRAAMAAAMLAAVVTQAPADDAVKNKARIQCWTDKSGVRMCGDNIPPEYAGQKREVIKDGRVVDTVKASRTPEEAAEEKRAQQAAEEASRRADYDRALVETYRSGKDIEAMRDERLALIDTRILAMEKNAADTDKSLEGLRARVAALTKDNKPVDEKLAKQVKRYERAQIENQDALKRYRAERDDVKTKFDRDLARFNELKAASDASKASGKPAAGKK